MTDRERYVQVLGIQKCILGFVEHNVTVRRIDNRYHVRIFTDGLLNQEAYCMDKSDIGYTARSLLRWEDKCGNISEFASAARKRLYS
jgi:hypothetical protein